MQDNTGDVGSFARRIFDEMPCLMFVKDESGRFVDGNRAFLSYMGVQSLAELVGLSDSDFYDSQTAARFAEDDRRVMEGEDGNALEFVQTSQAPGGRVHYLRMKKKKTTDESGRPCLLGLAVDETDLHEALESARRSESVKSLFFSTISHDIRTPLNAIVGFSELLKLGYKKDEDRQKALNAVVMSANMLQTLLGNVLDLSKLETGKLEILRVTTDCARLVRDAVDQFAVIARQKGVKLNLNISVEPLLEIDANRVRQIIVNLVSNAVKFTSKGQVDVTVSHDAYAATLTISVQDTGCGISTADQQRIADPYLQAERRGRNGGSGFGLAIVRRLVQRMNGEMSMSSAPGVGSLFSVVLPEIEVSSAQRKRVYSATQRIKYVVGTRKDRGEKHILVADDSKLNLLVLRSMLVRLGYTKIVTVSNGREALEKLASDPFITMVLTDVWMPEVNGLQLAREIRTNQRYRHVKVFAVTADTEIRSDYAENGFLDVLYKPVTLDALGKVL